VGFGDSYGTSVPPTAGWASSTSCPPCQSAGHGRACRPRVRRGVAGGQHLHAVDGRTVEHVPDRERADERRDAREVHDPAAAALGVRLPGGVRRTRQRSVAVYLAGDHRAPPPAELRQPLQQQVGAPPGQRHRQRDVRPLARGPVRGRLGDGSVREAAHQLEQVVVGLALVEVLEVQADHEPAHGDGSTHIGFV
jgi:hypothetical protein